MQKRLRGRHSGAVLGGVDLKPSGALRTVSPRLNATVGMPTFAAASRTAAPQGSSGGTSRSSTVSVIA